MRIKFNLIVLFVLCLSACSVVDFVSRAANGSGLSVQGSGKVVTEKREVNDPFQNMAIGVAADMEVKITKGPSLLEITGDDNIIKLVTSKVEHGSLVIRSEKNYSCTKPIKIVITMPTCKSVNMAGTGALKIHGVNDDRLNLDLSGACNAVADGKVESTTINLSGAGEVDFGALESKDAVVKVSGAGNAVVNATNALKIDLSGVGSVKYKGHPLHVTKNISGVASVNEI